MQKNLKIQLKYCIRIWNIQLDQLMVIEMILPNAESCAHRLSSRSVTISLQEKGYECKHIPWKNAAGDILNLRPSRTSWIDGSPSSNVSSDGTFSLQQIL